MARVDPVGRGLLYRDAQNRLRIPPLRSKSNIGVTGASLKESHLLAEYALHQLEDGDHTFTNPAFDQVEQLLAKLAPEFGYDPSSGAVYNNQFRNPALCFLTTERVSIIYGNLGLDGVRAELKLLRGKKVL